MSSAAARGPENPGSDPTATLRHLDIAREEVASLVVDRARWEATARRQQEVATAQAEELRNLATRAHRAEIAAEEARADAEAQVRAQAAERQTLAERLRQAEATAEQARAAAEAQARRTVEGEQRSTRFGEESCRLHTLQLAQFMEPDTLFDNILEASVELAGAEKGAYLQTAHPFAVLATERFDEARSGSPLLGAVAALVAERQDLVVANEPSEIASLASDPLAASLRNLVGFPIVVREQFTGVVVVFNKQDGPFTEDDTRLLLGIGNHAAVALENQRLRRSQEVAYAGTVALLCDVIEAKDPSTHGHCEEVAALAMATARELGLGLEEQRAAFQAGLLHDVGKVAVSDNILLKQGPLLPAERAIIEIHPAVGADLVRRVPALDGLAPIILHHHERWDGTGYPDRLVAEAISPLARVVGVVDAYQAMRSTRPYCAALGEEAAGEELRREAGTQFDPRVVAALLKTLADPMAMARIPKSVAGAEGEAGAQRADGRP